MVDLAAVAVVVIVVVVVVVVVMRGREKHGPTVHPPRSGTICVQPDQDWHWFKANLGKTAEGRGGACMGISHSCNASPKQKVENYKISQNTANGFFFFLSN